VFFESNLKTVLQYFNLLDQADFFYPSLVSRLSDVASNPACVLIQPHTCACNMYIILSIVINW